MSSADAKEKKFLKNLKLISDPWIVPSQVQGQCNRSRNKPNLDVDLSILYYFDRVPESVIGTDFASEWVLPHLRATSKCL